ncbi:hypothetical protein ACHAXS_001027 [Conticribra weissflogii]
MLGHVEILHFLLPPFDENGVFPLVSDAFFPRYPREPCNIFIFPITAPLKFQIMQAPLQLFHLPLVHQPLHPHITQILTLHNPHTVTPQPPLLQLLPPSLLRLDHPPAIIPAHPIHLRIVHSKVKFIGVTIGNFLAHGFETGLFTVVVGGAETVIFFLFEETEMGASLGLGALLVGDAFDGVAEGGHDG